MMSSEWLEFIELRHFPGEVQMELGPTVVLEQMREQKQEQEQVPDQPCQPYWLPRCWKKKARRSAA